ncbi:MAG: beta-glucosidase [Lachnospiraceae bacterium]|nr:beta-glucosidase [Lachnospiraceae bacterium]
MGFKKDMVWGGATASYQIEGAAFEDGKGLNVWDICCEKPGFVRDGDTGIEACDHYHRYKEDVALMKQLGFNAYRFSLSWARILPDGTGKVNEAGLDFYDKLVDELLSAGIEPYVTLFHWDYPYELYKKGGWLNKDSSDWFAEYTKVVVDRLSDRVTHWMTLNEPQLFINTGHADGVHAPGLKLDRGQILIAGHNALLAHGKACQVIRKYSKKPCEIGFAPAIGVVCPATTDEKDIEAAKKAMFEASIFENATWSVAYWMEPVMNGRYPEESIKANGKWWPDFPEEDMKIIHQPIDFCGMNSYFGSYVKAADNELGYEFCKFSSGYPRTEMDWEITPEILYYGPKFLYERYKKPILITENGMAGMDFVHLDGKVHDPQRIDFLHRYLKEYKKAADDGVDIKGYLQWSLMDNFEWAEGYRKRFGLIYVDYETKERILKDSAYWYADVIKNNGENL